MNFQDVEAFIELAKKHNLSHLSVDGLSISFPATVTAQVIAPPRAQEISVSANTLADQVFGVLCKCGHPKYDHRADVGCTHGCDVRLCVSLPSEPGQK